MLKDMKIPFAAALNKAGGADQPAEKALAKEGVQILGKLADSREVAGILSRGKILSGMGAGYMRFFERLAMKIRTCAMEMAEA
jgi:MinD superfamily P-loop ATPase